MHVHGVGLGGRRSLNESPSEKEGKSDFYGTGAEGVSPSMKVPPKRKGNDIRDVPKVEPGNPQ